MQSHLPQKKRNGKVKLLTNPAGLNVLTFMLQKPQFGGLLLPEKFRPTFRIRKLMIFLCHLITYPMKNRTPNQEQSVVKHCAIKQIRRKKELFIVIWSLIQMRKTMLLLLLLPHQGLIQPSVRHSNPIVMIIPIISSGYLKKMPLPSNYWMFWNVKHH